MAQNNDMQKVSPDVAVNFFNSIMPFNDLDRESLEDLARHCRITFSPVGTRIFTAGKTEINYLHFIQKGGVKTFITDDEGDITLKDYRGEGSYVGALAVIRGTPANLDVETVEDTFFFLLPKDVFLDLLQKQPGFAQYYLKSFSEKVVNTAYTELRHHKTTRRGEEELYLFTIQVGDIIKQDLKVISSGATVQEAARAMAEYQVGSLLVHKPGNREDITGIITDRDLRNKVIAAGLDYSEPVEKIMTTVIARVLSESVCFDALIKMMTNNIHHLAVERKGRITGVVTSHDIMLLQGYSPYLLFKEINKQRNIEDLYPLSRNIVEIIRNLLKEGAKAGNITRMISILNDAILERLLTLLEEEMGPPPLEYCWLLFGSEGRREQTFKTDQDNGLIYADPENEEQAKEAEEYFSIFSRKAIDHLVECGYPLCPGEVMAVNPRWRQPVSVWKKYFEQWVMTPDPQEVLNGSIFFDFRAGYGKESFADDLRNYLVGLIKRQEIFLMHLAGECINSRTPLSFFRNFIVEKDGEHKNKLDVKRRGLVPFVSFARVLSLLHGIRETNTLSRLNVLHEEGHISEDLWSAARNAYEMQMQQRLVHQLYQIDSGVEPDNYIDPGDLTELERKMLKDAFAVIDRLRSKLKSIFPVV